MLHLIRFVCFFALLFSSASSAMAEAPGAPFASKLNAKHGGESTQERSLVVVAHAELLEQLSDSIDAPLGYLFDRQRVKSSKANVPAMTISQMLGAKCFIYCPSDESPIEAIYRERLSNHGVKVIAIAPPSSRETPVRVLKQQQLVLLAAIR